LVSLLAANAVVLIDQRTGGVTVAISPIRWLSSRLLKPNYRVKIIQRAMFIIR
jgi:hypothetical protein